MGPRPVVEPLVLRNIFRVSTVPLVWSTVPVLADAAERSDRAAVRAMRDAMLEVLRGARDGEPLAGRRWPARYAAHRIAWHALDHAWEIQDRSDPADD